MPIFIALPQGGWYPASNPEKYCGIIVAPAPFREMIAINFSQSDKRVARLLVYPANRVTIPTTAGEA